MTGQSSNDFKLEAGKADSINCRDRDEDARLYSQREVYVENITWKDIKYQIWVASVGSLFFGNGGMMLAFSNLMLHEVDTNIGSWFASIIGISIPLGSLIAGPLMDRFGRKQTNLLTAVPCILPWFVTSFSSVNNHYALFGARFMIGLAAGLSIVTMVYVSEISHKKYRAALTPLAPLQFGAGILVVSVLQLFMPWRGVACSIAIFYCGVATLVAFTIPESPIWLAKFRSDMDGAKRSLRRLNPNAKIFDAEWKELCASTTTTAEQLGRRDSFTPFDPTVYKPCCILVVLFTLGQLTLLFTFVIYAVKIFPLLSPRLGERISSHAFLTLGVARAVGNVVCCAVSVRFGRRPVLLASTFGMVVSSLLLAVMVVAAATTTTDGDGDVRLHEAAQYSALGEWCKILLFAAYIFFGTVGVTTIPFSMVVEMLPHVARSVGSSMLQCYLYFLLFGLTKIFPSVLVALSAAHLFAYTTAASCATFAFVYFFLPETAGKSFTEIEAYFRR